MKTPIHEIFSRALRGAAGSLAICQMGSPARITVLPIAFCLAAYGANHEGPRAEEARACTPCHSLAIVHSQRLSRTAWTKEIDKMAGWGAQIDHRQELLDYLADEYGESKPRAEPQLSSDDSKPSSNSPQSRP